VGLSVTAYSNVKIAESLPPLDERDDWEYDSFVKTNTQEFLDSAPSLGDGLLLDIRNSTSHTWHAGSYRGYNIFRRLLTNLVGYEPEEAWHDPEVYTTFYFYELVNFSDYEGTIDSIASKRLLYAFISFRREFYNENPGWSYMYDEWIKGLTLAADNGILHFH
jgi:hypothetical protein